MMIYDICHFHCLGTLKSGYIASLIRSLVMSCVSTRLQLLRFLNTSISVVVNGITFMHMHIHFRGTLQVITVSSSTVPGGLTLLGL